MRHFFDAKTTTALVVSLLFWSSAYAGIRVGLQAFNPFHMALYRFLVASFALAVYALFTRMRLPDLRDIPLILAERLHWIHGLPHRPELRGDHGHSQRRRLPDRTGPHFHRPSGSRLPR